MDAERRARFEQITQALGLPGLELSPHETLRRGTLALPSTGVRRTPPTSAFQLPALPRLDAAGAVLDGAELTLGDVLGAGGMGAVFSAHQHSLQREVAVKRLRAGAEPRAIASLLTEARVTGALEHPSIVPVHVLGVGVDGTPLLVMKRIEGATLEQLGRNPEHPAWKGLEQRYGDRLGALCELLMRVADALHFAHSRGYVHRDVKPANVMIGSFGEVYLVDWGIALRIGDVEEPREVLGTPTFMAPEMVDADPTQVDARTDVYLLGATLHWMLTGTPRHAGESVTQILLAAFVSAPFAYDPDVPEELAALANRATAAAPEDRPPTALAFRDALADFLRHRGSLRLTRHAETHLAELEGASPATLATPAAFTTLGECRFALVQALVEWPGNARAKELLQTTLLAMAEAELERRSADGAQTLADALEPPDPSLTARIAALREQLEESRRLEAEALAERKERDLVASASHRRPIVIGLIAVAGLLFLWALADEKIRATPIPMERIIAGDMAVLGLMASLLWIFRAKMLANRLSRQLASLMLLALAATTLVDQIFAWRDQTTAEAGALSVITTGSVFLGAAIGIGGRLWIAAAICFVCGTVAALQPATTVAMVGIGSLACLGALAYDSLVGGKHAGTPPGLRQRSTAPRSPLEPSDTEPREG